MARSIHTTRSSARRLRRTEFSDAEAKEKLLTKAEEELDRKRLIKRQVRRERKQPVPPAAGTPPETIPIEIRDVGPYVHHGLTEEDVRAMLAQLPPQATEGISRIQLSLRREYLLQRRLAGDLGSGETDPFIGRIGEKLFPGVYCAPILGGYAPRTGRIYVHAYVCDPTAVPMPWPAVEAYLKLQSLSTLLHEIAHHCDRRNRVRRGRWLADRKAAKEHYAEAIEYVWVRELAIPHLERHYADEVSELRRWIAQHGGVEPSLEFFAGDQRITAKNGFIRISRLTHGAFENWVGENDLSAPLSQQRLAFAEQVHYADEYELCLTIVERVLAEEPGNPVALTWKADTLTHLERHEEARALAQELIRQDRLNSEAWWSCVRAAEHEADWLNMLGLSLEWSDAIGLEHGDFRHSLFARAVALSALGRLDEVEAVVAASIEHLAQRRALSPAELTKREEVLRRNLCRRLESDRRPGAPAGQIPG